MFTIFVAAGISCTSTDDVHHPRRNSSGIIGGTPTEYLEWKGVVALRATDPYWLCTGALIHPQVVLTAGHCVFMPEESIDLETHPDKLTVLGGANMEIVYSKVEQILKHPYWHGDIDNTDDIDLAIIKLAEPVPDVDPYRARSSDPLTRETGWIVGYGLASDSLPNSSRVPRKGQTTILRTVGESLMELGQSAGMCLGDSGGPFFTKENQDGPWVITGVASFGTTTPCNADEGNWYVNTKPFGNWIEKTKKTLLGEPLQPDTDSETETDIIKDASPPIDTEPDTGSDKNSDTDNQTDAVNFPDAGAISRCGTGDRQANCNCVATGSQYPHTLFTTLLPALFWK